MRNRISSDGVPETKRKLLEASVSLMRARGFNGTSVDDICSTAGVTKGGFFHYFKSKDEITKAAVAQFHEEKTKVYDEAPFRKLTDPLKRVFGRLDYVTETSGGASRVTKGCLIGMLAQELASNNSGIRNVCQEFFTRIADDFAKDLTEAKAAYAPKAKFDPDNVAQLYVALIQGSLLMAKTAASNEILANNIEQFRNYIQGLFGLNQPAETGKSTKPTSSSRS